MFSKRKKSIFARQSLGIKHSTSKKIFSSHIALSIIGLVIILFISFPLAKNISKQYKINNEIKLLQEEISQLNGKNENLKNLISFLESDQFIDEEARKNLNFKKEGENVVIIKNNISTTAKNPNEINSKYMINQPKKEQKKRLSNPEKWLKYFFWAKTTL